MQVNASVTIASRETLPVALLALAIGAFAIGSTEFVMMGLLPEVAAAFNVSIPTAGYLISGYALGVVFGAPLLTAASVRWPRRTVLLGLMVVFTIGNVLAAMAPSYETLLAARVLTGLPHGAFFGVASVAAVDMAPAGRPATAISIVFAGLTIANVVGVPTDTLLSQHFGWRATFALLGGIGVISMAAIASLVPDRPQAKAAMLSREIATFARPQVWLALAIGTFGFGGVFAAYSYIEPMMTNVAGYSPGDVDLLLALFGLGMTAGNLVGGRLADRALMPSLYGALGGLALVLALFVLTAHDKAAAAATIFLIGATGMACVPIIQTRIMDKARGASTLAAAANHSAFNLANAAGARALASQCPDIDTLDEDDIASHARRFRGGINNWIVQTFIRVRKPLRAAGMTPTIGERLVGDCVNVAHRDSLNRLLAPYHRSYIVGVRADRPPLHSCKREVAQNDLEPGGPQTPTCVLAPAGSCAARCRTRNTRRTDRVFRAHSERRVVRLPRCRSRARAARRISNDASPQAGEHARQRLARGDARVAGERAAYSALKRNALDYIAIESPSM